MKKNNKSLLIGASIGGAVYAAAMAAFDFFDHQEFRHWRFVINFLFFGGAMILLSWYSLRNRDKHV